MKSFIAALILTSTCAFAGEVSAPEILLSFLPQGNYQGKNCEVRVVATEDKVVVMAANHSRTATTIVHENNYYRWRGGRNFFASTVTDLSRDTKRENFIRTNAVTESTQYVVVGDIITSSDRSRNREEVVECEVNL